MAILLEFSHILAKIRRQTVEDGATLNSKEIKWLRQQWQPRLTLENSGLKHSFCVINRAPGDIGQPYDLAGIHHLAWSEIMLARPDG